MRTHKPTHGEDRLIPIQYALLWKFYIMCKFSANLKRVRDITESYHIWKWGTDRNICPWVTVLHHEALPSEGKLWPEWQMYRSVPHTHDRFFFLHANGCWHLNKNRIYLEIFCILTSHFVTRCPLREPRWLKWYNVRLWREKSGSIPTTAV